MSSCSLVIGLKFYMRISECICNRIMMKKNIDFLTHLQDNLPLIRFGVSGPVRVNPEGASWFNVTFTNNYSY